MADLARLPAFATTRKVMDVVDALGALSGSVDASRPGGIVVQFPVSGLGDPSIIADSACRSFIDAGFQPVTMDVNDRTARFVITDLAA